MTSVLDGTRFVLPPEAATRLRLRRSLLDLYESWGYEPIEVPALEHYRPDHPRAAQSFKLSDRDSGVLALRSDFTPALARLVRTHFAGAAQGESALRLQYQGKVWHAIDPDMARTREFTQVGIELIGVSNARADAELIHLARESLRAAGLTPRVEVGNPGFVRALFDLAAVPEPARPALADAIDRKDEATLRELLAQLAPAAEFRRALEQVPDIYGDLSSLALAREVAPWAETLAEIERLEEIVAQFEDPTDLLLDLGMARRLSYYTGMTFRAYTFDYGQPLLGGGRYDGALLPYAAGFSIGLERLAEALPRGRPRSVPLVLSRDDAGARTLRRAGVHVVRALGVRREELLEEARAAGADYLLDGGLEALGEDRSELARLQRMVEDEHGG